MNVFIDSLNVLFGKVQYLVSLVNYCGRLALLCNSQYCIQSCTCLQNGMIHISLNPPWHVSAMKTKNNAVVWH